MIYLKKDATPEFVAALRQIEERADACFESLELLSVHSNKAMWSMLVGGIALIEAEIESRGSRTRFFAATLINISQSIPVALNWITRQGKPPSSLISRRWDKNLATRVRRASLTARYYSVFLNVFPLWHRNQEAVELISPTVARFTLSNSSRDRQVSAYHKGFRVAGGMLDDEESLIVEDESSWNDHFAQVLRTSKKTGEARFEYRDPPSLWRDLLPAYTRRLATIVRRSSHLSVGDYTIGEFKRFYAALLSVSAAHEHLCFMWGRANGQYPLNSSVLVRSPSKWASILSDLSGISHEKCLSIISDLTISSSRTNDLHVYPFVRLDPVNLALAPQFPLNSRPDENILRACSKLRPTIYDVTSLEKETEMLTVLCEVESQFVRQGPIKLPGATPDIDLLVSDESASTLVIAELKWIMKPSRSVERPARDAEIRKGIGQLHVIRRFLIDNPDHLRLLGKVRRRTNEYAKIHYLLVARDHWLWVEPFYSVAVVDFRIFLNALRRQESLNSSIEDALKYEWLPVQGRDFRVQYDRITLNGVAIETEVYYPI